MTRQYVSDDQCGQLWCRLKEIARRVVDEGSIPFDTTMRSLQLVVEGKSAAVYPTYPVTVNYDLSLAGMIKAARCHCDDSCITEKNFPVNIADTKEVVTEIVHLNREISSSEEVLRELDRRGLRPATIEEQLAFGAKYPEIQKQFPIVALGSVLQPFGGSRLLFPYLWGHSSGERSIELSRGGFHRDGRFLAVRE